MEDIGQLVAGLESFVRHYGAFAVMPILAIEAVGAPVPGESLLIFASLLAGRGEMSLPPLLIFAWIGSVLGDNLGYLIGRKLGRETILRHGTKIGLTDERFKRIEAVYVRYGAATVLFARFFSILRQLNGIVAGMLGMSCWRFVLLDAFGAALWVMVWVFAAAWFTEHLSLIIGLAHHTEIVVSVLVAIGLAFVLGFFRPTSARCGLDNAAMTTPEKIVRYGRERVEFRPNDESVIPTTAQNPQLPNAQGITIRPCTGPDAP